MSDLDFTLAEDAFGQLQLTLGDGSTHAGVVPVRAFPIAAPDEGVSLVGHDGHELVWVPRLSALDASRKAIIEAELAQREFMPVIERIVSVSSFVTPSQWTVATNRGETTFTLKAEDDIRRISTTTLLIADSHGVHYLIQDLAALDRNSKKLLDRFL
ncbi:MAG: DUF1854 domain-containing protein [Xanthomonadaceae bacterium]|nr:DUF1854 domain-containing protein [Xanthomonadaceae bacterium]